MTVKNYLKRINAWLIVAILSCMPLLFIACNDGKKPEKTLSSIAVTTLPSKTVYAIGEAFSAEGGKLTATYSNSETEVVALTDSSVKVIAPSTSTPGTKKVSVEYGGKETSFDITVKEKNVKSIAVSSLPTKTEYITGQKFIAEGGMLKITYADDTEREVALTDESIELSSPDMTTAGDKTITVTYGGQTTSFTINVALSGEQKAVGRVKIKTAPTKINYLAGDAFDPTGGVLTVTYTDKTTEDVSFTDRRVTFGGIDMGTEDMNESVQRTISVSFGNRKTTFTIGISAIGGRVTFNTLCNDVENLIVKVAKGSYVTEPETPTRNGYEFYKWYEDENCTIEYEFGAENIIDKDITVYAQWKQNGATYHSVIFDYNYYGLRRTKFAQLVKDGEKARAVSAPARAEFTFDGWFTDSVLASSFNINAAVKEDMTIRAKWTKTKKGSSTYVFEAENTDLTGKKGPGYSGEANDGNMVVVKENLGASGDKAVSYLYRKGLSLEFYIASSEATTANLKISMAAELDGVELNQDNYKIYVNGVSMDYSVRLTNGANFIDVNIGQIELKEGYNLIKLVTDNTAPELDGTYEAYAPMIDCVKIETSAVLTWDDNYGLPKKY